MRAHIELSCWVDTTEEILEGDIDRLVSTFEIYLKSCGGLPEMGHTIHGSTVHITGFVVGKSGGMGAKRTYIRKAITDALKEAGMEVK